MARSNIYAQALELELPLLTTRFTALHTRTHIYTEVYILFEL